MDAPYVGDIVAPVASGGLRQAIRGGEIGIRASLKAHVARDIFQNVTGELEDPPVAQARQIEDLDANGGFGLEPELSEISRPRSRSSTRRSHGPYGGTDMGGSTIETLPPGSDWNAESSV